MNSFDKAKLAVKILDSKKARDIDLLKVQLPVIKPISYGLWRVIIKALTEAVIPNTLGQNNYS